jgi:hypothetical protein
MSQIVVIIKDVSFLLVVWNYRILYANLWDYWLLNAGF